MSLTEQILIGERVLGGLKGNDSVFKALLSVHTDGTGEFEFFNNDEPELPDSLEGIEFYLDR